MDMISIVLVGDRESASHFASNEIAQATALFIKTVRPSVHSCEVEPVHSDRPSGSCLIKVRESNTFGDIYLNGFVQMI